MDANTIVLSLITSGFAVAIIGAIKELVIWLLSRKAKKEDDQAAEEKEEDKFTKDTNEAIAELKEAFLKFTEDTQGMVTEMTKSVDELTDKVCINTIGTRVLLQDKIKYLALRYIKENEIEYADREMLRHMWNTYHYDLGGNGDLNIVMRQIDELPLKIE